MSLPAHQAPSPSPFHSPTDWFAEHTQHTHRNTPPHGQKRPADEQDEAVIPPYNGFKRLRISPKQIRAAGAQQSADYTYVQHYHSPTVTAELDYELPEEPVYPVQHNVPANHVAPIQYPCRLAPEPLTCDTPPPQQLPSNNEDYMPLDDNPHRIFIDDLDAAIAEIEAEERAQAEKEQEAAFFLPEEVEKEISGVPEQILRRSGTANHLIQQNPGPSQALILYRDPESISISEENDAVRKAVHEARRRIRERKDTDTPHHDSVPDRLPGTIRQDSQPAIDFGYPLGRQNEAWRHGSASTVNEEHDDFDAMDIG